jgi:hypothetical protein
MIKKRFFMIVFVIFALFLVSALPAAAIEIKSQYAVIIFNDAELLKTFNNTLFISRFKYLLKEKRPMTVEEEVMDKIDLITAKVEQILEMFPPNLQYTITLCENMDQVRDLLTAMHNKDWKRPGFYSPSNDTVYLSARNGRINVVAHEVGHVVVEKYFKVRPPVKIHELLAQFAEKNINE